MCAIVEETIISSELIIKLQNLIKHDVNLQFYKEVGKIFKEIFPNIVITVNECNEDGYIVIRYVNGYEKYSKALLPILGKEPHGLKIKEFGSEDLTNDFLSQKLVKYDGNLHKLCKGKIAKTICIQVEKLAKINNIFIINLAANTKRFGSITFLTSDETILDNKELIESICLFISNIIDLKQKNNILFLENSKFKKIFENSTQAISIHQNGRFVKVNDSYAKLFGYSINELIGQPVINLVAPENRDLVAHIIQKRQKGEKTLEQYEAVCQKKDGSFIDILIYGSRFELNGEIFNYAFLQDLTERNRIEKALAESEENLFEIINSTPDPICVKDPNGKWILANTAKLEMMDLQGVNYVGKDDNELSSESSLLQKVYQNLMENDKIAWEKKDLIQKEEAIFVKGEQKKIFDVLRIPHFDSENNPKSLITWGRDITERIDAEEELKSYRSHLEDLVEERASELIKTIKSLSSEVSNRKKVERIIQIQNRIANELISSEEITLAVEKTLQGISEICDSEKVCFWEIQNSISTIQSRCLSEKLITVENKKIENEKIQRILGNKKTAVYNVDALEMQKVLNCELSEAFCSILPIYYLGELIGFVLVQTKNRNQLSESIIKVINSITLQLESIISQFISKYEILENEKRWKTLYKNLPGGTLVFDKKFIIRDVNDLFCELTGFQSFEIIGKKLELVCADVDEHFINSLKENKLNNVESEIITKSGDIVPVIKNVREIEIKDEIFYLENFQSIGPLKSLQKRISKINDTFLNFSFDSIENINSLTALIGEMFNGTAALYNCLEDNFLCTVGQWNTPDDFLKVDKPDGHICYDVIRNKKDICLIRDLNKTKYFDTDNNVKKYELKTYFGKAVYRDKQIVGSLCVVFQDDFIPTNDDVKILGIIAGAIGGEEERRFINKELADYRVKLEEKVRVRTAEISFAHERIQTEIEKHKETVDLLKETEKEYQRLFENSHDAQILIEFNTRKIIKVNHTACDLFKFEKDNSGDRTLRDLFGPKSEALFYDETYKQTGNKVNFEINSNNEFYVDINASIIDSSNGKIILVSCRDITETKLAQKQLSESQRRYEELVQNANDIIIRFDKQGRILYVNPITEKNLGYTETELIGENVLNFVDPDHKQNAGKFYLNQQFKKLPNTYYELPILKKDGSIVWLGQNVQLISNDTEVIGFQAVARNITQRKNAEYAMVESEKRFRTIAESINTVAIYGIDVDKKIIFWNSACEKLYGYSGAQAHGEDIRQLLYKKKDISEFEKEFDSLLTNLEKPVESEKELVRIDGSEISVLSNKVLLQTSFGGIEAYYLDIDLTKRKETEKQLQRAKKLAEDANKAKSGFLTNISHELRTPLNGILGYAQSLKDDPDLNLNQFEAVEVIEKSGNHLLALIEDILDLSKIETKKLKLSLQEFNFIEFVRGIAGAIKIVAENKGLSFEFEMLGAIPEKIKADEKHLGQVLYNLLGNAVKFTKKGSIKFKVESTDKKLKFTIIDTGIGIPEKQMDEIFSPFIQGVVGSMKSQGTGLGLTISKRLVRMMGGNLKVNSVVGSGSEFYFEIKVNGTEKTFFDIEQDRKKIIGYEHLEKLQVLIVDDDYNNRAMLRKLLSPLGFITTEADNGKKAIELYNSFKYDLVLLDIMMPDINGFEVTSKINKIDPEAKVIIISASSSEKSREKAFLSGCSDFLSKPLKFDLLFNSIEEKLNLTWILQGEEKHKVDKMKYQLNVPELATLNKIINLAKDGEINKLNKMISDIKIKNIYPEFTSQILIYSKEFQINEIINFAESFIEE